jgi:hypothetical protein
VTSYRAKLPERWSAAKADVPRPALKRLIQRKAARRHAACTSLPQNRADQDGHFAFKLHRR